LTACVSDPRPRVTHTHRSRRARGYRDAGGGRARSSPLSAQAGHRTPPEAPRGLRVRGLRRLVRASLPASSGRRGAASKHRHVSSTIFLPYRVIGALLRRSCLPETRPSACAPADVRGPSLFCPSPDPVAHVFLRPRPSKKRSVAPRLDASGAFPIFPRHATSSSAPERTQRDSRSKPTATAHSHKCLASRLDPPFPFPATSPPQSRLPSDVHSVHLARLRSLHLPCYRCGGGGHVLLPRPFPSPGRAVLDGEPRAGAALQRRLPRAPNPAGNNRPFAYFFFQVIKGDRSFSYGIYRI
jgi:hypothetical protein